MHNLETNHVIACILRRNFQKWNIKNRNLMKTFFLNKNYLGKLRPTQFHNDVKNANLLGNELGRDSWENLVKNEIYTPLGMAKSKFFTTLDPSTVDIARAYKEDDGSLFPVPFEFLK